MPPRNPSDRYAELERLNGELIPAINDRDKARFSEETISAQAKILEVILEFRKEAEQLADLDPDDRRIQALLDALRQIPKGRAPAADVDRLAARLVRLLAGGAQNAPIDQAQTSEAPSAIVGSLKEIGDKTSISGHVPESVGREDERAGSGSAPVSREEHLQAFIVAHPGTTLADIKHSACVHTPEFQDWRRNKLKSQSAMSGRIEDVLSGTTQLKKKPRKPRPE